MDELASHGASAGVELALETQAPRSQLTLLGLSTFPSRFTAKAAGTVLDIADGGAVRSQLATLKRHALVRCIYFAFLIGLRACSLAGC
jgi:hypothetical protein